MPGPPPRPAAPAQPPDLSADGVPDQDRKTLTITLPYRTRGKIRPLGLLSSVMHALCRRRVRAEPPAGRARSQPHRRVRAGGAPAAARTPRAAAPRRRARAARPPRRGARTRPPSPAQRAVAAAARRRPPPGGGRPRRPPAAAPRPGAAAARRRRPPGAARPRRTRPAAPPAGPAARPPRACLRAGAATHAGAGQGARATRGAGSGGGIAARPQTDSCEPEAGAPHFITSAACRCAGAGFAAVFACCHVQQAWQGPCLTGRNIHPALLVSQERLRPSVRCFERTWRTHRL